MSITQPTNDAKASENKKQIIYNFKDSVLSKTKNKIRIAFSFGTLLQDKMY